MGGVTTPIVLRLQPEREDDLRVYLAFWADTGEQAVVTRDAIVHVDLLPGMSKAVIVMED